MQRSPSMIPLTRMVVMSLTLAFAGALGCSTPTSTTHLWQAQVRPQQAPQNVLVFGGRMSEPTRRTLEEGLVRELSLRGVRAAPSYQIFPQLPARDIAQDEVKRHGFDGAVVATLRQIRERQTYVPGHFYGGFWGSYYGPGWGMGSWSPGYVVTDELVNVETTFWNLRNREGDLVWASNTETRNPSSTHDFVESYVEEIMENLEQTGLVKKR